MQNKTLVWQKRQLRQCFRYKMKVEVSILAILPKTNTTIKKKKRMFNVLQYKE